MTARQLAGHGALSREQQMDELGGWLAARGHAEHLGAVEAAMAKAHIQRGAIVPLLAGMGKSELARFMASCASFGQPAAPAAVGQIEPEAQDLRSWLAEKGYEGQLDAVEAAMAKAAISREDIVPLLAGMGESELQQFMASCARFGAPRKAEPEAAEAEVSLGDWLDATLEEDGERADSLDEMQAELEAEMASDAAGSELDLDLDLDAMMAEAEDTARQLSELQAGRRAPALAPVPPVAPPKDESEPRDLADWLEERGHAGQLASVEAAMAKAEISREGIVPLLAGMGHTALVEFMASCAQAESLASPGRQSGQDESDDSKKQQEEQVVANSQKKQDKQEKEQQQLGLPQKEAEEEPTGARDLSEVQRQVEENTSAATAPPVAASPRVVRSQRRRPELLLDAESTTTGDSLRVMESVKEALHEEVTQLEDATPEEAQPAAGEAEPETDSDSAKASKADGVESPEVASLRVQLRATEAEVDELAATNRTLTTQLKAVLQTVASRKASVDRDAQLEAAKHQVVKECAVIAHRLQRRQADDIRRNHARLATMRLQIRGKDVELETLAAELRAHEDREQLLRDALAALIRAPSLQAASGAGEASVSGEA